MYLERLIMPKLIACEIQDYFESACIYHYQLAIELVDGTKITGKAVTLKTISKVEYLVLVNNETEHLVNLAEIKSVNVLTQNAKFKQIEI